MKHTISVLGFLISCCLWAYEPPEFYAKIGKDEAHGVEKNSIRNEGIFTRVTVRITPQDSKNTNTTPGPRLLKFVVNCSDGNIALSGVELYDYSGRLLKLMVVPPGGSSFQSPQKHSPQEKWVTEVCN